MNRAKVESSAFHSMGHDETGLEVQYHAKDCATVKQGRSGSSKREAPHGGDLPPSTCNCSGGDVYHHPGVGKELHDYLLLAPSLGSAFMKRVKTAKHPDTGELLYPHVKREAAK